MINQKVIEQKIKEILEEGLGLDWQNNPHLKETPKRVAKVYTEIYDGYDVSPTQYLKTFPTKKTHQQIIIGPIKSYSTCSHHMLPFSMDIYIGYIPNDKILGISKFERIVKNISHKLQVQENITEEICDFLYEQLQPEGVIVLIKNSKHLCMEMRGVENRDTHITTSSVRGVFSTNPILKSEFLNKIQ